MITTQVEDTCPICGGRGKSSLPMSEVFTAKVSTYISGDKKRTRLEIKSKLVDSFIESFGKEKEVAIFVVPMSKIKMEDILD